MEREEAERVFNGPCRQILCNSPVYTFIKIKDPDKDCFFFRYRVPSIYVYYISRYRCLVPRVVCTLL